MPIARPEQSDARVIAHVDMDCFYVQVEQRRHPELKGLPTAVVQYNAWKGGGLIAVGYEARKFGVKRSMRGDEAKKVCPEIHLVQVPVARGKADLNVYRNAGSEVVAILSQRGRCERASIDEVYLDLTDAAETMLSENPPQMLESIDNEALKSHILGIDVNDEEETGCVREWMCRSDANHRDRLLACGAIIVAELRMQVLKETEFTCSAGIAHNKMLAKLASGMNKPAQQTVVPLSAVNELLASLPIKKMKQLGGKLGSSLQTDLGVNTVGDLLQFSEENLQDRYGINTGTWLWNVARGINGDEVEGRLLPKSHGSGKTFPGQQALKTITSVERWLNGLCEDLSERIQSDMDQNNRVAHTLTLHARAYMTNESDSHKKFPSRSCPLRYGTAKIQEDALKLFNSGLREYLGSNRVETYGNQNKMWGVTALSVTASKILSTTGTGSILKYFHGRDPSCTLEEHMGNKVSQDTEPATLPGFESSAAGNTTERQETNSDCNKFNSEPSNNKGNKKRPQTILRFFNSQDPCSSAQEDCSGIIQDNIQALPSGTPLDKAEARENGIHSTSNSLGEDEQKKGTRSILRYFGTQSPSKHVGDAHNETQQGKQKWSFNVEEIDPAVIDELPEEIQAEVRGWLKPPPPSKRANTGKSGSLSISHYFLPTRNK